jgi:hypothetical protein
LDFQRFCRDSDNRKMVEAVGVEPTVEHKLNNLQSAQTALI